MKAIANGALIKTYNTLYYVVYFSAKPEPGSYSDNMIKTAIKNKIIDEVRYLEPKNNFKQYPDYTRLYQGLICTTKIKIHQKKSVLGSDLLFQFLAKKSDQKRTFSQTFSHFFYLYLSYQTFCL